MRFDSAKPIHGAFFIVKLCSVISLKLPNWLWGAILIGACILVFTSIRGCNQGHAAIAASGKWKKSNDSLIKVAKDLTQVISDTKKEYGDSLDFINGQLSLKNDQLITTKYSLDSADKRITSLLLRYKPIIPNSDTTDTTVPNGFITDCNDCFTELSNGQQKVKLYLSQLDSVKQVTSEKSWLQEKRIIQLSQQNTQLTGTLQDCLDVSKAAQKVLAPHGQLFFSWNVLWVPYLPTMAGMGLMYQNKYKLQIGVRGMFGRYGSGFETEVNMPLSLKRNR